MHEDQQTYQRGMQAAIIGMVAQLVLGVLLAVVAAWAQSIALSFTAWFVLGGVLAWLIVVLIYYQHQLERAETLEVEQLAQSDANSAAIFDEHGEDLERSRRTLERLYKWGLGVTSILLILFLAGIVLWQGVGTWQLSDQGRLRELVVANADASPIILLAATSGISFLLFILGRYIAGMTSLPAWRLLRGGAGYLIGSAFFTALLAVGMLFLAVENTQVIAWVALIIPIFVALLAVEFLLNFILNIYKPRRAGEAPRPAFDSRILGWLTSPESIGRIISETLNYQFGFEISSSWFYRLFSKAITPLIIFAALTLILMTSVVIVEPYQQAIIMRFGERTRVEGPGLHVKWPWPIGTVQQVSVDRVFSLQVGSGRIDRGDGVSILWTNEHIEGDEVYMVTAASGEGTMQASAGGGGMRESAAGGAPGIGLLAAEMTVAVRIDDLERWAQSAEDPGVVLENIAEREMNRYFVQHSMESLMSEDRLSAGLRLRDRIQGRADDLGLGLKILFVGLTGVHPPTSDGVAQAFHEQVNARQQMESNIERARREATEMLARVAGSEAQAYEIDAAIEEMDAAEQTLLAAERRDEASREEIAELERQVDATRERIEELLLGAQGEAAQRLLEAQAERWRKAIRDRAQAERFEAQVAAFEAAPEYYMARVWMEVVQEGLGKARKYVLLNRPDESVDKPIIRLDLKDNYSTFQSLLEE